MYVTNNGRNGIILRFPFSPKNKKIEDFRIKFTDFCIQKLKEGNPALENNIHTVANTYVKTEENLKRTLQIQ